MEAPVTDIYRFLSERGVGLARHLRTRGLDLPDSTCLRHCVRALDGGPQLALDADGAPAPEVDTKAMKATFVINTLSKDRMGDVVLPNGCMKLLPRNYAKNPRVFFSHRSREMPVGSSRNPDGSLALDVAETFIRGTCYFNGETAESELVFRMVARKELQAASIGFLPVKAAVMKQDKEPERPETDQDGQDLIYFGDGSGWFPALKFYEWDMTEWSIVPIPANADCIAQHLSRGDIEGEKLTDGFRKALEPWSVPRSVWSPGATLPPVVEVPTREERVFEVTPEVHQALSLSGLTPLAQDPLAQTIQEHQVKQLEQTLSPRVESKDLDNPVHPDQPAQQTPPLVPSVPEPEKAPEPYADWPHGAMCMDLAMKSMSGHCAMLEGHEPKMDHPQVKAHLARNKSRVQKLQYRTAQKANQLYPDHFPDPGEAPQEPGSPSKALTLDDLFNQELEAEQAKVAQQEQIWATVTAELAELEREHKQRAKEWFEMTGRKLAS